MNRRQFFVRAGLLAAAAAGLPRLASPAAAPALTPARRATYRRLVAVLREAPDGRFHAAAGTRAFAAWYSRQSDDTRAHADAVLDAAAGLVAPSYAALRELPGGAAPNAGEAHRRAVLMAAVALVEGPDAPGDHRAPTAALA